MSTRYHHSYSDFGREVMRDASMAAHLDAIVVRAAGIAKATAPEDSGEFKDSFVVGTEIVDRKGVRAVGFLASIDPKSEAKEFNNPNPDENRTMNKAVRKAIG